jgi:hypothetical protein
MMSAWVRGGGGAQNDTHVGVCAGPAPVMLRQGDTSAAVLTCAERLTVQRAIGPARHLTVVLHVLARVAERRGLLRKSARLVATVKLPRRLCSAELLGFAAQQADADCDHEPAWRVALVSGLPAR